ncbi:MAG: nucleoside kinase [Clostridia bacterium]|jgi:uridine kinase|nr:nucleoside kinase [Clostridia bacterium]
MPEQVRHEQDTILLPQETVDVIDMASESGLRVYRQSLVYLLAWAAFELFPHDRLHIQYSLGHAYYCEFKEGKTLTEVEVKALEAKMRELAAGDFTINAEYFTKEQAIEYLTRYGREDTIELLAYLPWNRVRLYRTDRYADFSSHILVSRTGLLQVFALEKYNGGLLLRFPAADDPATVAPKYRLPKLAQVWQDSEEWADILEVSNLSSLLRMCQTDAKDVNTLIHVGEALQEKKIARIADAIYSQRDKIKLILIAGPSSSGKTTFGERLSIQLRVLGLRPISLSTDDYFVDREHTPKDENGEYDFEALEAVDISLFNQHIQEIIKGETVACPIFNFERGCRDDVVKEVFSEKEHPIIIEGIHALNEKLTASIPRENKYKIYISALAMISIDDHNRIHTTDTRLIRRIVRDSQFRNQKAIHTLKRWPSVRRGEEKNIFPFQEDADIMFNSALIYELSILKKYAYPLLAAISPAESEYADARRLLELLDYVPDFSDQYVPLNSILREFIGGSSIHGK